MAKVKIHSQKAKYTGLNGRLSQYVGMVRSIIDGINQDAANLVSMTGYDGSKPFSFADYPITKDRVDKMQQKFLSQMTSLIYSGTSKEWKNSNLAQDAIADKALKTYGLKRGNTKTKVYYQTNSDQLKAFQERQINGMSLSQNVWNLSNGYKEELEAAISTAIEKGTSAVTLSKKISKYLADYKSLQKDYKERYGKATEAHDCEYRSIRLARSEINMAYRTAEQKRWQQMDFVIGYEIKLSGSHPHKDICDMLAGKYPKDFVWTGWHPNDLCYCVPILKTEEEFWSDSDTLSPNAVTDVPDSFKSYVKDNKDRISAAKDRGTMPYWAKDNEKYLSFNRKPFVLDEEERNLLIANGFVRRKLISSDDYNTSAMKGFDVLKFDSAFEKICDENLIRIKGKYLEDGYSGKVSLSYVGEIEGGEDVEISRYFRFEKIEGKREPVVDHQLFVLPKKLQGKGISKQIFRELFEEYENCGIKRAYIHANIDVGGLCWAKYGALAEKNDIKIIAKYALEEGKISISEFGEIQELLKKYKDMIPMQNLAYSEYGERLLLGTSWNGYIDLQNKKQMDYLHKYLGM